MIIQGSDLMIFIGKDDTLKSIGYATSHSLNANLSMTETSHKDVTQGNFIFQTPQKMDWDASSDSFMANEAAGYNWIQIYQIMEAREPVELVFGLKSGDSVPVTGWVPGTSNALKGSAYITNISLNAPDGDNATYTITFTGNGDLTATIV